MRINNYLCMKNLVSYSYQRLLALYTHWYGLQDETVTSHSQRVRETEKCRSWFDDIGQ